MRIRANKRKECGWIRKEKKNRGKERRRGQEGERERERGERNKKGDFPCIPTVEARRFEKKSQSTHRELRVVTKILEFRQTPKGKEFSYFDYF